MHERQSLRSVTWAGKARDTETMLGFKCRCRLETSLQLQHWTAREDRTKQHPLAQHTRDKGDRKDGREVREGEGEERQQTGDNDLGTCRVCGMRS